MFEVREVVPIANNQGGPGMTVNNPVLVSQQESGARAQSWRDVLAVHPACELFPVLPADELKALGEDIVRNGLTSPIVLWRADPKGQVQLLDGCNRLDAIELVAGHVTVEGTTIIGLKDFIAFDKVLELDESTDPFSYVVSVNVHRRHLTAEQKHDLIGKLLKATPDQSDRQIAETVKVSPTTVGVVRAKMEATSEVSKLDTRRDRRGRKQPARKTPTKSTPQVSDEVSQRRDAVAEDPNSTSEIPSKDARGALEVHLGHVRAEDIALRSQVRELT
jgi:hypothetical protein